MESNPSSWRWDFVLREIKEVLLVRWTWSWKNEGIVLKAEEKNETHDLHKSNVLERPKVIYNEKTGKYVMWMHIENANSTKASVGIAISGSPTGPFTYLYSKSPHGFDSRDMTIFKDGDGMAYLFYSSLHNRRTHIGHLSQDYLDVTNVKTKVLVGQHREVHAVFKHQGKYYMITSSCSGWAPNEALVHVAESIMGPWEAVGNPSVGANKVFRVNLCSEYICTSHAGGNLRGHLFLWLIVGSQMTCETRDIYGCPLIVEEEAYQLLLVSKAKSINLLACKTEGTLQGNA